MSTHLPSLYHDYAWLLLSHLALEGLVISNIKWLNDACAAGVGTLDHGYVRNVPLPRAPLRQSPVQVTCNMQVSHDNPITSYSEVTRIPTRRDLSRSITSLSRTKILPIAPVWLM